MGFVGFDHVINIAFFVVFVALLVVSQVRRATEARMGVYQEVMETAKTAVSAALRKDKAFTSQVGFDSLAHWTFPSLFCGIWG